MSQVIISSVGATPRLDVESWLRTGITPPRHELERAGFVWRRFEFEHEFAQLSEGRGRWDFVHKWGFSIPCAEAVSTLVGLSPIIEVGAGTGGWAAVLAKCGADVIATDIEKPGRKGQYGFVVGAHFPVKRRSGARAVKEHPGRTVFCSWPTYADRWLCEALKLLPIGGRVALIGESSCGCTGDDDLFRLLERDFRETDDIPLPVFPGMHDALTILVRDKET